MWRKRDSDNLESIAKSLEKLLEREQERNLVDNSSLSPTPFLDRMKQYIKGQEQIKVTDGLNPEFTEDAAIEEEIRTTQRLNTKIAEAKKDGNTPFWAEDLLNEEELEMFEG